MKHLKKDSEELKKWKPGTDDYEFAANDCKNLVNSTKKWLKMENLSKLARAPRSMETDNCVTEEIYEVSGWLWVGKS